MSLKASFEKKVFEFKRPGGTSRGVMTEKKAWFITVWQSEDPEITGVGECSIIEGLSPDYDSDDQYEAQVARVVRDINTFADDLSRLKHEPSILFGLEMALLDLKNGGKRLFYATDFYRGNAAIPINGLIWMGEPSFMSEQIQEKLDQGFSCIKMKIGAIDFDQEVELLEGIRKDFNADQITLRVDANGAFSPVDAPNKLKRLAVLDIHSIEQPIKPKQWEQLHDLCAANHLPVALDEELIGVNDTDEKINLLDTIQPQYIILKPSLMGGFTGTAEWINLAEERNIPWWITSALESNIGLDAIAQFTSQYNVKLPQGLGTGSLYTNNIESTLTIDKGHIKHARP
ncbi:MAG: o-succinylbenzoate synthase [Bacteroidota bacterium]